MVSLIVITIEITNMIRLICLHLQKQLVDNI